MRKQQGMLAPLAMLTITPEASFAAAPPARLDPARRFPYHEALFDNSIVKVSLEQETSDAERFFSIVAKENNLSIDEDTVSGVFNATELMLGDELEFRTLWDLRSCPIPTPSVVLRCMGWAMRNKRTLDQYNLAMAIVLPSTRPTMLLVVNHVLRAFSPKCAVRATADVEDARVFLRNAPVAYNLTK